MGKIKLNLVSGAVVEKPLINAFKANNNSYVVLDNEMNGSMGLPIILVCKLESNKLIKILDQNEWSMVKEYLKNIIAGNQIEFIKIDTEIAADDIYYTQLTLPVPSFDALKNAYKVEEEMVIEPTIEVAPTPVEQVVEPEPVVNVVENQQINLESPVIDIPVNPVVSEPVVESTPTINEVISPMDIVPPMVENTEVKEEISVEPVINVEPEVKEDNIFKDQKEAFMQACENMFDALVQKFERELENRK